MFIRSYASSGYEGSLVTVEVDLRRGIPGLDIIGLPDSALREAKERVRIAIRNSGFRFPDERILINLAPASVKKAGTGFDLAIAYGILKTSGLIPELPFYDALMIGELELSGRLRPIHGVLSACAKAEEAGCVYVFVPFENAEEARALSSLFVFPVASLKDCVECSFLLSQGNVDLEKLTKRECAQNEYTQVYRSIEDSKIDAGILSPLSKKNGKPESSPPPMYGQEKALRAIEAAALGPHALLLFGPPGAGKTLSARLLEYLMSDLSKEDSLIATRLHSNAGILPENTGLLVRPPFRSPHHSASVEGVLGGGRLIVPGEVSLAHGGVLFLDEAPEFRKDVLQGLREPIEEGYLRLSRAGSAVVFPSRCILVLAMNPCPCGNLGKKDAFCVCSDEKIANYWKRIGGPLLDRIDLRIPMKPETSSLFVNERRIHIEEERKKVDAANQFKAERSQNSSINVISHAEKAFLARKTFSKEALSELNAETELLALSNRSVHGIILVARSLSDLDLQALVEKKHVEEACEMHSFSQESLIEYFT